MGFDEDGERHLYVNEAAAGLLRAVMRVALPRETVPRIAGTTLTIPFTERLAKILDHNARTGLLHFGPRFVSWPNSCARPLVIRTR